MDPKFDGDEPQEEDWPTLASVLDEDDFDLADLGIDLPVSAGTADITIDDGDDDSLDYEAELAAEVMELPVTPRSQRKEDSGRLEQPQDNTSGSRRKASLDIPVRLQQHEQPVTREIVEPVESPSRRPSISVTGSVASLPEPQAAKHVSPAARTSSPVKAGRKPEGKKQQAKQGNQHGKVIHGLLMTKLSQHMHSESTKREAGIATAMAVKGLMAIGTSRGVVLIYNIKQLLQMMLKANPAYGAVTAIAMSYDSTRLLVGHEHGQILRWDLTTGKVLNSIMNVHPKGLPIMGLTFTDDHKCALSVSATGPLFMHSFKRVVGVRTADHTCLFTGGPNSICAMKALFYRVDQPDKTSVLALGSRNKVMVVFLKPTLTVGITFARQKNDGDHIPSLAWNIVPIKNKDGEFVVDPVLAFTWGYRIYFLQVQMSRISSKDAKENKDKFGLCGKYDSKVPIISISWLTEKAILVIDAQEHLRVIDVRAMELVEVIDLARVKLVFNTKLAQAIGNSALSAKLRSYSHSVADLKGNVYLLGTTSVHLVNLLTWTERIAHFVAQSKFVAALALAYSVHLDTALAISGTPTDPREKRAAVRNQILELMEGYVDIALSKDNREMFDTVVKLCLEYTLLIRAKDFLFQTLYDKLSKNKNARECFLSALMPLIQDGRMTTLTPIVMQDFVEYMKGAGRLRDLQQCILNLDIANLDIHQVVIMCWKHGLYDAMIYVYNRGMIDYITPLKELLQMMERAIVAASQKGGCSGNAVQYLSKAEQSIGYTLLLYISNSLAGRAFPVGEIPEEHKRNVQYEVYKHITARNGKSDQAYPNMTTLLRFDTKEFLNVLALAFDEEHTEDGPSLPKRQAVVDILLEIMVSGMHSAEGTSFSPEQVGYLFTFLARQVARHKGSIAVDMRLFEQMLCSPTDRQHHEERQQALLELLQAGGVSQFGNEERLLNLAKEAEFYRVCQLIHTQRGDYAEILPCYLKDAARQKEVFSFIHHTLQDASIPSIQREKISHATTKNTPLLVKIDSKAAARLFIVDFSPTLRSIVASLEAKPDIQFELLQNLYEIIPSMDPEELDIPPTVHERYIELMCEQHPEQVYPYLRSASDYRIEECLEIVRDRNITDATAWLLERKGDIHAAYSLIHATVLQRLTAVTTAFVAWDEDLQKNDGDLAKCKEKEQGTADALGGLLKLLENTAIEMCLRVSPKLDEPGREGLWFPLLDALFDSQKNMKRILKKCFREFSVVIRRLSWRVVTHMMEYVAPPAILRKIMADTTQDGRFGEIKELILGMLETYNYETLLLKTTNQIVDRDLYLSMWDRLKTSHRGMTAMTKWCGLCRRPLSRTEMSTSNDGVAVFRCGHWYHVKCTDVSPAKQIACYLCHPQMAVNRRQQHNADRRQTFSLRELLQAQQQATSKNEMSPAGGLSQYQCDSLGTFKKHFQTPDRLDLLNKLIAGKAAPSELLPESAATSKEQFNLKTAPPRHITANRPPRMLDQLPDEPQIKVIQPLFLY